MISSTKSSEPARGEAIDFKFRCGPMSHADCRAKLQGWHVYRSGSLQIGARSESRPRLL